MSRVKMSKIASELMALPQKEKFKWNYDVINMFDIIDGVECFDCDSKIGFWSSCYTTVKKSKSGEYLTCCLDCWREPFGSVDDKLARHPYSRPSSNPASFAGAKLLDAFYIYLEDALEVPMGEAIAQAAEDDDPIWELLEVALEYEEALTSFRSMQVAFESYGNRGSYGRGARQFANGAYSDRRPVHQSIGKCAAEGCKQTFCNDNLCSHIDHVHPLIHCAKTGHVFNAAV